MSPPELLELSPVGLLPISLNCKRRMVRDQFGKKSPAARGRSLLRRDWEGFSQTAPAYSPQRAFWEIFGTCPISAYLACSG